MNKSRNQNALLIEIMIAVLFFALCSTVLLETFMAAREQSRHAGMDTMAVAQAQDLAEMLYAGPDAQGLLDSRGFTREGEFWLLEEGEVLTKVRLWTEDTAAGTLHQAEIAVYRGDEQVIVLPAARYAGKEAR